MRYIPLFFFLGCLMGASIMFACSAHAMEATDASAKCATAIDGYLRDPSSAQYQWHDRVVTGSGDSWGVMLPVRAQNAFGGYVMQRFGCVIVGGRVVKVIGAIR